MIVQIAFQYDINLDRILYAEHDRDMDYLKIIFDNGTVLVLRDGNHINEFEKHIKYNTTDSVKN